MSREMAVIALGIWVIILPHLGVPGSWHTVITTITGVVIIAVGLYVRAAMLGGAARRTSHHPFVESSSSNNDIRPHSNEHSEQGQ